jgi:hypothetical protein
MSSQSVAPDFRVEDKEEERDETTESHATPEYSEEYMRIARQWGVSVEAMLDVFETVNLYDPYEGQPEYSPEWPIDFVGDGFYADDMKWLYHMHSRTPTLNAHGDTPLHMHPAASNDIDVSINEEGSQLEVSL